MTFILLLALLGPKMAYAAAFSIPKPTQHMPAMEVWSPAPTAAPQLLLDLSRRQENGPNTCGYVSGSGVSVSAVTCPKPTDTCVSNTYYGIHGCCDPSLNTACTIATSCIASKALPSSCTDTACTSDAAILKCTESSLPACYEWHFIYDRMVLTQHGCAALPFTSTAYHSLDMTLPSTSLEKETVYATITKEPSSTPTPTPPPPSSPSPKPSLGAIVGGTIGACLFLSFIAFVVFLAWRRRRTEARNSARSTGAFHQRDSRSMVEYNALGFSSQGFSSSNGLPSPRSLGSGDGKAWRVREDGGREWQGMGMERGRGQVEIVEVDGTSRAVEAPTAEK